MKQTIFILCFLVVSAANAQNVDVRPQQAPGSRLKEPNELKGDAAMIAKLEQEFDSIKDTPDIATESDYEKTKNAKVEGLIRLTCVIHKLEDPLFDVSHADPGTWNVSIPLQSIAKGEHFVPGMDPEKIKDPKMKQTYLMAIKANETKREVYIRETGLRKLESRIWSYFRFYSKMLFRGDERLTLDHLVDAQVPDASLRAFIKKQLGLIQE